ncbi:kila N-terminal domain N1R/P28 DNA binding protein [Acanthamoeba polyphaga mimivirus]|uniref:Kila N-terminal domain N1R/P28 DNA binding protein n=1 Tax=Acanthamoeba polyphaga mimivirus TaxID=212035 RepID=A0A0G2Y4V1_MIMIV|nr:kila N-terminal domain N1R/P28 DNA binding protein [Acanthamoeba polyphaga mimivirus]
MKVRKSNNKPLKRSASFTSGTKTGSKSAKSVNSGSKSMKSSKSSSKSQKKFHEKISDNEYSDSEYSDSEISDSEISDNESSGESSDEESEYEIKKPRKIPSQYSKKFTNNMSDDDDSDDDDKSSDDSDDDDKSSDDSDDDDKSSDDSDDDDKSSDDSDDDDKSSDENSNGNESDDNKSKKSKETHFNPDKKISKQIVKNGDPTNLKNIMISQINNEYYLGQYGNFEVIIMAKNDYINVTKLCSMAKSKNGKSKLFVHWKETADAQELIAEVSSEKIQNLFVTKDVSEKRNIIVYKNMNYIFIYSDNELEKWYVRINF